MQAYLTAWLIVAGVSGILGSIICGTVRSGGWGFLLGALFGPLGILIAQRIDNRPECPTCGGKWNVGNPSICPHCGREKKSNRPSSTRQAPASSEDEDAAYAMLQGESGSLRCSECKAKLKLPEDKAFFSVTCPACGKKAVAEPS